METNLVGRVYQSGRNTVKAADFEDGVTARARRIENFLTEMLALLIEADWRPIARALGESIDDIEFVEPCTQQRVFAERNGKRTLGIVDIVLVVHRRDGRRDEIWLEVKAGAGLHGDQLHVYAAALENAVAGPNRRLVVLDTHERSHPGVVVVTWRSVVDAITSDDRVFWLDFGAFVVAQGLAVPQLAPDPSETSISDEELSALLTRVLVEHDGSREWPRWMAWGAGKAESIRKRTLATAVRRTTKATGDRAIRFWAPTQMTSFEIGLFARDPTTFGVRLVTSRWYPVIQEALRQLVARSQLDPNVWEAPERRDDDVIAAAYLDSNPGLAIDQISTWMILRISDLSSHGLLADLDVNGKPVSAVAPS